MSLRLMVHNLIVLSDRYGAGLLYNMNGGISWESILLPESRFPLRC